MNGIILSIIFATVNALATSLFALGLLHERIYVNGKYTNIFSIVNFCSYV